MPPKNGDPKKEADKGKDKKTENKKTETTPGELVKRLMRLYKANCEATESAVSARLIKVMEKCIEDDHLMVQFIFESNPIMEGEWPVKLEPLIKAIRSDRYVHIKELYIWKYLMAYETIATLSEFLSLKFYPIRTLELRDCNLTPKHIKRFSNVVPDLVHLTHLNLDYNEFGSIGCWYLCDGLNTNPELLSLSLCYCNLGPECGGHLNDTISKTAIRDVYLDGNHLDCEGAATLILATTDMALSEDIQRAENKRRQKEQEEAEKLRKPKSGGTDATSKQPKKKKKGKKNKKASNEPRIGPWIRKLSLVDNDIDNLTQDSERLVGHCLKAYAA